MGTQSFQPLEALGFLLNFLGWSGDSGSLISALSTRRMAIAAHTQQPLLRTESRGGSPATPPTPPSGGSSPFARLQLLDGARVVTVLSMPASGPAYNAMAAMLRQRQQSMQGQASARVGPPWAHSSSPSHDAVLERQRQWQTPFPAR